MNALHAERARIVHLGLLNAPNAIWESMVETPSVSHAQQGYTRIHEAVPNAQFARLGKNPMREPPRAKSLNGKSKRTANLVRCWTTRVWIE